MKRSFSLYVHIPFCARKCPYCDFNTYAVERAPEEAYVAALLRELDRYSHGEGFGGRSIGTVFFGGGTPSILSPAAIGSILQRASDLFGLESDSEVTLEANPTLATPEKLGGFKAAGINRLSFGAQSFSPRVLELLGRDHAAEDIESAVRDAEAVGFENQSLDIIFGVPEQDVAELRADLEKAAGLPIRHISTYSLTIERGTPFFQRKERGLLTMPPEDTVADMLEFIPSFLATRGFERYEVSNYARAGCVSRHNRAYWLGDDYLGVGAGAHSFVTRLEEGRRVGAQRWSNRALPTDYMKSSFDGDQISWRETLDSDGLIFEFFFLGLRKSEGVSLEDFHERFGRPPGQRYMATFEELEQEQFVELSDNHVRLTTSGVAVSDSVFERLLAA